ncbi:hypothetical protein [Kocuria rosea]|uniref:hypothetical protein n=1 Tax=Kocuria rosea TaxID=1275 RepID=UPI0011A58B7F|nr:hypothetical protein [Kocuria rosea]
MNEDPHLAEATVEVITQLRRLSAGLEAAETDPKKRFALAVETIRKGGGNTALDPQGELSPLVQVIEKMHPAIRYASYEAWSETFVLTAHVVGAKPAVIPAEWFCPELIEVETHWGHANYPHGAAEVEA